MKLYSYYRSSASYRVRIALALKGLSAEIIPVNLLTHEQKSDSYRAINPQGLVPALIDENYVLTQSIAIMEYLDEKYPVNPLLPLVPQERARVRALALAVACEMSPLCNSGPLGFLGGALGCNEEQKTQWYHHWMAKGFTAIERMLDSGDTGSFCHGSLPGMADCVLVPQVYNARRYHFDLTPYPTVLRIISHCDTHPAFRSAHPSQQVDAA